MEDQTKQTKKTIRETVERELRAIDTQLAVQFSHGCDYMVVITDSKLIRRAHGLRFGQSAWHAIELLDVTLKGVTLRTKDEAELEAEKWQSWSPVVIHWREFLMQRQASLQDILQYV